MAADVLIIGLAHWYSQEMKGLPTLGERRPRPKTAKCAKSFFDTETMPLRTRLLCVGLTINELPRSVTN